MSTASETQILIVNKLKDKLIENLEYKTKILAQSNRYAFLLGASCASLLFFMILSLFFIFTNTFILAPNTPKTVSHEVTLKHV